jgi:hypothetical protein
MPRPQRLLAATHPIAPASVVTPGGAGVRLCWVLYRRGAPMSDWADMRCQWDVLYVREGSRFVRQGWICARCGDTRAR